MRIESIESHSYRVPLRAPWGDQTHRITHLELVVTDVRADNGLVGTGFSYSVGIGAKAVEALLDWYVAPTLIGREVAPRPRWREMWVELHDAGGGGLSTMALAACDLALWDLVGKEQDRALVKVLGQLRERIPAYGSGVNLNLDVQALRDQVRRWLNGGYHAVKVKVGKAHLGEDLARLEAVRAEMGNGSALLVDANQGWDLPHAELACRSLERFDVAWVEEPLLADDIDGHARLRSRVRIPIAVGENVYTRYQFNQYLDRGACDVVQADVVRVGGITPWLEIASLAETWNVPVVPHFLAEISGQLLCCVPNAWMLEDVEGGSLRDLGLLSQDVGVTDGWFTPPQGPGHGIVFDRSMLARCEMDREPAERQERLWHAL